MITTRLIVVLAILKATVALSQPDLPLMSIAALEHPAKDIGHVHIAAWTGYYEDKTRALQVKEVLKQHFGAMPDKNCMENSHANTLSCNWLKFQINNFKGIDTLKLLFFTGVHGKTELFELHDSSVVKLAEGGLYTRMGPAEGQINANCLPINVPPGHRCAYLISVHDYFKMYDHVRTELFTPTAYQSYCQAYKERQMPYLLFLGVTIGGLGILVVFGLMQFFLTRGRAFIWYSLFALVNCLNIIRVLEMSVDTAIISGVVPGFKVYFMIAPAATTFCYLKFTWYFLDLPSKTNLQSRWIGRLVTFFGGVLMLTSIIALVNYLNPELSDTVVIWFRTMHLLIYILGILIIILVAKAGGILNRFIAAGTLLLLIGGVISTWIEWGIVQKPLHEIDFPFDPKVPLCIFSLLESLCFALGLGYKTKILEIEKREAILEQERQRIQISSDLHDEMGSTLSSISILSETALRDLQQDMDRARFGTIGERARQMIDAMSDIVWSVNPHNDTMVNVLQRMKEFAVEILEPQGIALHFEAGEAVKSLNLTMEHRKDFYLLYKEAVNNAAKYSGASEVWVTMWARDNQLHLEVRDNGRGFDTSTVKPGNGLWNMRRRVERMSGVFVLESAAGAGTSIQVDLHVPIA